GAPAALTVGIFLEASTVRLRTFGGLWIEDLPADAAPRPRALALLAILAAAGAKGASRDRILGVLWPDAETERARHALSQTIYSLRKDLGLELVVATPDLRLDASLIGSDVAELGAAVRAKEWREAAALYTGPFLEGFYLADAPEFERWVETERSSLAASALRALEQLARESATNGRDEETAEVYRRLVRLDPVNSRYAIAYMEALDRLGDRTGALAHGKAYADHLKRELEIAPDRDVQRVIARLRDAESAGGSVAAPTHAAAPSGTPSTAAQSAAPAAPAAPPELAPEPAPVSEPVPLPTVNGRRIRRRTFVAAGVVIVLAIGASLARRATGAAG